MRRAFLALLLMLTALTFTAPACAQPYGPYGGYRTSSSALYDRGYRDGFHDGEQDAKRGRGFDYDSDRRYSRRDERFRALMGYEIARAHALYEEAWPGIRLLNPDGQLAVAAAAEIYRGILANIVANKYDVFTRRAHVPLAGKLLMLPRIWRRLREQANG